MKLGGPLFSALSLLALACGQTSETKHTDDPQASGGAAVVTGGAGRVADTGGTGGKALSAGAGAGTTESGGVSSGGSASAGSNVGGDGAGGSGGARDRELSYVALQGAPIYTRAQRLTNRQWENAVTDILRFEQRHDLSARFARPLSGLATFDNNERILDVAPSNFIDFESGAEAAAAIATGSASALNALYEGSDATGFVRALGRRAFRRPLTQAEEAKYQDVFALGERLYGAGFANGAALVVRAMLESPRFLYRTELGPAGELLDAYELASKLSFWLLGTTPSDALLDAAAAGTLASDEGLQATARQMLDDPRATESMRDFHGQLLGVESFRSISKVGVPEYDTAINPELALASYAFLDLIFGQNLGASELLTSKKAYVSPGFAVLYGFDASAAGLELRDIGPARSGYFMQVPFLMLGGSNAESDPSRRGVQLETTMLCGPPHALDPTSPDPLGVAFESFDGLGRQRDLDNGQPIATSGTYPFAEGVRAFADGNELMQVMASSSQVHTCYSKHITGYALGRDVVEQNRPLLESLAKVSLSRSVKDVLVALVRDPAFRAREQGLP